METASANVKLELHKMHDVNSNCDIWHNKKKLVFCFDLFF